MFDMFHIFFTYLGHIKPKTKHDIPWSNVKNKQAANRMPNAIIVYFLSISMSAVFDHINIEYCLTI